MSTRTQAENESTVTCKLCGKEEPLTLNGHLQAAHDLTAPEYREKVGEDAPIVSKDQVYKMHNEQQNPYWSGDNQFWRDVHRGVTIEDTYSSVTCRVCGENYANVTSHIPSHGIEVSTYRDLYPNAPLMSDSMRAKMGGPHIDIGSHDWRNDLQWSERVIMQHRDVLDALESTEWFDDGVYERLVDILSNEETTNHRFVRHVLGAAYIAANDGETVVPIDAVCRVSDSVDETRVLRAASSLGSVVRTPHELLDTLDAAESDSIHEQIDDLPDAYVGSRRPRVVVAVAMYLATDTYRREISDVCNVTGPTITNSLGILSDDYGYDVEMRSEQ